MKEPIGRKPIYSWKRLLFSVAAGLFMPLFLFLIAVFLRAFRAPDEWTEPFIWSFGWPYHPSVYPITCWVLPSPQNSWVIFGVSCFLNILIASVTAYIVTTLFGGRIKPKAMPPLPPSFAAEDRN